ncbi:MAG: sigma factor, partial [candidate division WOR-3 bacterium]
MPEANGLSETELPGVSDDGLLAKVAQRDERALAELFRRYQNRVMNLAYRYLRDRDAAELATQDTFVNIWNKAGSFRGEAQVWTWIYRITVNLCYDRRPRRLVREVELDEMMP